MAIILNCLKLRHLHYQLHVDIDDVAVKDVNFSYYNNYSSALGIALTDKYFQWNVYKLKCRHSMFIKSGLVETGNVLESLYYNTRQERVVEAL